MRNQRRYRSVRATRTTAAPRTRLHPLACASLLCLAAAAPQAHAAVYVWNGGTFVPGVTAPEPMLGGNTLQINSGSSKNFNGVAFTNQGTVAWNADALGGATSASVTNQGVWNVKSDANSFVWQAGGQPVFRNSGTLRKSAGSLSSLGNWQFINDGGLIDAQTGTLNFNGGAPIFNDNSRFTGAGSVNINTAASFNGGFGSDNLVLGSGVITGNAAKLEAGVAGPSLLRWSGGQLAGSWEIASGQFMSALSGGSKQFVTSAFTNNGSTTWQTTESLQGVNSGQWVNNGLFDVQASASAVWIAGGQPSFINNASGVVRASNAAQFNTGNLLWTSNGGNFDAEAGASIAFNGGFARFNNNTRFTGEGSIAITSNALFVDRFESANLTLTSGTYTGGDGSTGSKALLSGKVGWSGGQLAGTWQIAGGKTLTGLPGSAKQLSGNLTNVGNIKWATVETLQGLNSATLLNRKVIDVSLTSSMLWLAGGQPTLTNGGAGIVRASAGATFSLGNWNIVSDGGRFDAKPGSTLLFNGPNNTFRTGTRFIGKGKNTVTGTARFVGNISTENLRMTSGSFAGGDGTPGSRALLAGTTEWQGGDFSGAWTLPAAHTLNVNTGTAAKRLAGADIVNAGTLIWNNTDGLAGYNSAVLTNDGAFEARKSTTLTWLAGGQPSFINNASAIVRASQGATLTFNNFSVTSNGSRFDARQNSSIVFSGGYTTFNDNTQFLGTGSNRVTNSARFVGLQRTANLTLGGGTLTGGNGTPGSKATLRGTAAWTGGDLAGAWLLEAGQSLSAAGAGSRRFAGANFSNLGDITWSSNDNLQLFNSASLVNDGNFLLQSDADMIWLAGGQPSVVNNGLLRKTAGSGDSSFNNILLTNNGTMQVDTGSITLPTGFSNGGVLSGSGSFNAATVSNGGVVSPGDFQAVIAASASPWADRGARLSQSGTAATLSVGGNYTQTAAGSLDIQVTNASNFDRLLVSGNASLTGALNIGCLGNCNFSAGQTLVLLDAGGPLTGSFSSVNFVGLPAGSFNVSYDAAGGRVLLNVTAPVAVVGPSGSAGTAR